MTKSPVQDLDTRYIRQIRQQQVELALAKTERDATIRERDVAQAQSAAMAELVNALLASLRPYGFTRKRCLSEIRTAAGAVPDQGPEALQNTVLSDGAIRILDTGPFGRARPVPRPTIDSVGLPSFSRLFRRAVTDRGAARR